MGFQINIREKETDKGLVDYVGYEEVKKTRESDQLVNEYQENYALTTTGEPVNIQEYAARIVNCPSTHVICILE